MLLAAERMHDRALQRFGEPHQLRVSAGATATAKQRYALGSVEQRRQLLEIVRMGRDFWRRQRKTERRGDRALRRLAQRHVARNGDDCDSAQSDGRTNGVLQNIGQLASIGDQLAVVTAFPEQVLRMRLLKVTA